MGTARNMHLASTQEGISEAETTSLRKEYGNDNIKTLTAFCDWVPDLRAVFCHPGDGRPC
jgi:hypothetical protein